MKLLRTLVLALFFVSPAFSGAQSYDFSTTYGFNTAPNLLVSLTDNRWLAVCTGSPNPGAIFIDTVVAIVFDANGTIQLEKRLALPPSEIYTVNAATGTPDGGFAINLSRDLCDASNQFSLLVFDSNGNLKWSNHDNPGKGPLGVSASGNLMVLDRRAEKLLQYNLATGDLLSTTVMKDPIFAYGILHDFEFLPGENAFISVGSHILERWERQNDGSFLLVKTNPIVSTIIPKLVKNGPVAGQYFTFQKGSSKLFRFNASDLSSSLLADYPFQLIDVVATPTNLFAVTSDGVTTTLRKLDFQGGVIGTVRTFATTQKAYLMGYQNNTLTVMGQHYSGPTQPYNARQLWIHTNHLDDAPPAVTMDAALSNIQQKELISIDSSYLSFINAYIYYFSGGAFWMEITNNSNTLLESVDVNISFEANSLNICPYRPAKTIHYDGLGLLPNESTLVEFSGINAPFQPTKPAQLCFWLSNPNRTPDVAPGNDTYCHSFNTVGATEPEPAAFLVSPNPANSSLRVTFQEAAKTGAWKLFDVLGRPMKSGALEQGSAGLDIPTVDLPAGMYNLWVNGRSVKVVVAH